MGNHASLFQETARYVNRVIGRKAVTAKMFQEWLEEAKRIRKRKGPMGLFSHYQQLYKQMLTEQEMERLKASPKITELSFRMIEMLVDEGVLTPTQARLLKQYVK